jgi:acetyl-CoA synthetase
LRIDFSQAPERILDATGGAEHARWLPGARLNIAASCWAGRDPAAPALAAFHEDGSAGRRFSRGELRELSERVARGLQSLGLGPSDAIAVDMPMTALSVPVYLGIVLLGGAVVSIADSFAPDEIATRLRIANARAVVTQDVILRDGKRIPLYERVLAAHAPAAVVIPADGGARASVPLRAGDLSWDELLVRAGSGASAGSPGARPFEPHLAGPEHVTNVLFSSGTTGEPKAIPWTQVTPIKAAADGWAHPEIVPGDVLCWPTNLGWMMGPWLIYASLLGDASMAVYEGAPGTRGFCRFVQDAGVTMLGLVPSLVRSWRGAGHSDGLDWSRVRRFSSTGEASAPDDYLWLMGRARGYRPVIEYCGGTEIGGGYICGSMLQAQSPATFSTPAIGCDFVLVDEAGSPCDKGELALLPPILGSSSRLLNRDHHEVYFDGMPQGPGGAALRRHGDEMERLPGGWYRAHGRVDDTMNLGGIKVSSAEIERACAGVAGVLETAAVAVPPAGGGPERLVVFAVHTAEAPPQGRPDALALRPAFQARIRERLNPLFRVDDVRVVSALPRTASGKVMRRVLRKDYEG